MTPLAGLAQDTTVAIPKIKVEAEIPMTTGVEGNTVKPIVLSCPLTPTQLTAVRAAVGGAFIGGNADLYHYFKKAWWSGTRADHFFFHADWDQEFRDQDKLGHMLGGYHLTRIGYAD